MWVKAIERLVKAIATWSKAIALQDTVDDARCKAIERPITAQEISHKWTEMCVTETDVKRHLMNVD